MRALCTHRRRSSWWTHLAAPPHPRPHRLRTPLFTAPHRPQLHRTTRRSPSESFQLRILMLGRPRTGMELTCNHPGMSLGRRCWSTVRRPDFNLSAHHQISMETRHSTCTPSAQPNWTFWEQILRWNTLLSIERSGMDFRPFRIRRKIAPPFSNFHNHPSEVPICISLESPRMMRALSRWIRHPGCSGM